MNIPARQEVIANQSAGFISALKAGGFPPLVPNYLLKNPQDLRNNAGPSSFTSKAAKGVMPGAKISPRFKMSLLPSWNETWTKAEDWIPVPKGQEDVLRRSLGSGFRAHYGYPYQVVVDVDEMASSHGAFGSMRMEQVNRWLDSLNQASIPPPDTIEFVNSFGRVDKMVRIPPKKQVQKQASKATKTSPSLPTKYSKNFRQSPSPTKRQSSSEFPIRDRKGKGKVKSLSDEDKEIKELINDTMSQIFGALKFEDKPKSFDEIIDQALAGDNWIDNSPPASKHYWNGNPSGLTTHKPMPSSSQIKKLGPNGLNENPFNFHGHKKRDCFHGTAAKEDRIAT